jgi:hypothetical protein
LLFQPLILEELGTMPKKKLKREDQHSGLMLKKMELILEELRKT